MNPFNSLTYKMSALLGCALMASAFQPATALAQKSVSTQHNDLHRDGVNANETILTPSNVNQTQFGLLFKDGVDDQVFAQPLVISNVSIGGGTHNVLYVATSNNSVYAFDADSGHQYWHINFGTAPTVQNLGLGCSDMLGTTGIVGTPVVDIPNNWMYVVDQLYNGGNYEHQLHKIDIRTGSDASGSPVTISHSPFNSKGELQRTGLLLSGGNIYFAFASHCDQGTWKGYVFGYSASSLAQTGVFDDSPNANGGAIWQSGNGLAAEINGSVFTISGNGSWDGSSDFSETMFKLNGSGLAIQDWHTPSNYSSLDKGDTDQGTTGIVLLPNNEAVGGGKDGVLRVVKTTNMGHLGDSGNLQNWQATGSHIHSLVFFNNNLYEWGQSDYLKRFSFNGTTFNTQSTFKGTTKAIGHPGGSLSLSANGTSNGILWAATNRADSGDGGGAWHGTVVGILHAYDVSNMSEIWNNRQNSSRDDCNNYAKFTPPTIVNGKVYLASFGTASTKSGQVCVYGILP
jgi:hypothetical protein